MSKVVVIGGGPAGCFAAYYAAQNGNDVILIEKNEKLGKKLYITGKGRCNVTNASDMDELLSNVMGNNKFLYSAFNDFSNKDVMEFFENRKTHLKIERGNRVFPKSDHSSDIISCLKRALDDEGVEIMFNSNVKELIYDHLTVEEKAEKIDPNSKYKKKKEKKKLDKIVKGVVLSDGSKILADKVVVATGGFSYQTTGSTGDGYKFAENVGHKIIEVSPALVPFNIKEEWVKSLQGLSLKNVSLRIMSPKNKKLYEDFGEMLFTHFGVSGPMILSASSNIKPRDFENELHLFIDLKPALDEATLDKRILREFESGINKQFKNVLGHLFPTKLIPIIVNLSTIDADKQVNDISRVERLDFVKLIKNLPMTIVSKRSFNEAIITKGGVTVKEVDPSTMGSKVCKNLFFCGEVLDLDALTGGYNLQIAWSTGHLAGISC
ncbi:NAD(P)/FAD-dependent oxidoreductase [Lachnobacterium bovis]|uniref:Uncharacterized protein n=1 Tax=Lachnobacterium bovis TaxID=140626 RepID=A0A1H9QKW3_9FIRM|nr:NAD(P)/FAD-dependent oxidoreductase [Lachnobacterium bovis]SER61156.1 hypothetical protein SAMN02910429_00597 [Lachnobacterium bovis]